MTKKNQDDVMLMTFINDVIDKCLKCEDLMPFLLYIYDSKVNLFWV